MKKLERSQFDDFEQPPITNKIIVIVVEKADMRAHTHTHRRKECRIVYLGIIFALNLSGEIR